MVKKDLNEQMYDDGTYAVEEKKKFGLLAFVLCLVISFVIWIYVTNQEKKEMQETSEQQPNETAVAEQDQFLI